MRKCFLKTGLAGYPVKHSLSPVMHNTVYQHLGLCWHYDLYPCSTHKDFLALLACVREPDSRFVGLNVTTPWKKEAFFASDQVAQASDPAAQAAQAANVLTVFPGTPTGKAAVKAAIKASGESTGTPVPRLLSSANTDGKGIVAALERAGADVAGSKVLLCGTGAVASVALVELLRSNAAQITLCSRDQSRAARLAAAASAAAASSAAVAAAVTVTGASMTTAASPTATTSAVGASTTSTTTAAAMSQCILPVSYDNSSIIEAATAEATIVIDATTVSTGENSAPLIPAQLLNANQVVLDVNYGRGLSPLLAAACSCGARALDGLEMLVEQAALSIELWGAAQGLELKVPRQIMRDAASNELRQR